MTSEGPGRGSQFTGRLPWQPAAAPGSSAPRPLPPDLHVLLVEDHVDTADAMTVLLEAMGLRVTVAGTVADARRAADEAARSAAEFAAGGAPGNAAPGPALDLVISDLDLPDGNGLSLMTELASRHGLRGIALSGFGMQDDMQRSRDAGFARHLVKPVNLDELEDAIRALATQP